MSELDPDRPAPDLEEDDAELDDKFGPETDDDEAAEEDGLEQFGSEAATEE